MSDDEHMEGHLQAQMLLTQSAPNLSSILVTKDMNCRSILISGSSESSSLASSSSTMNSVSFAPLPKLEPRKRYYTLGVAARSTLLRQRSGFTPTYTHTQDDNDIPSAKVPPVPKRRATLPNQSPTEAEDPLQLFGRMLTGAGKNLWRKVVNKSMENHVAMIDVEDGGVAGLDVRRKTNKASVRHKELHVDRVVQYTLAEENEEEWEKGGSAVVLSTEMEQDSPCKDDGAGEGRLASTVELRVTKKRSIKRSNTTPKGNCDRMVEPRNDAHLRAHSQ